MNAGGTFHKGCFTAALDVDFVAFIQRDNTAVDEALC
jgi:hypothetical protein